MTHGKMSKVSPVVSKERLGSAMTAMLLTEQKSIRLGLIPRPATTQGQVLLAVTMTMMVTAAIQAIQARTPRVARRLQMCLRALPLRPEHEWSSRHL